jgi:hypothetical protein
MIVGHLLDMRFTGEGLREDFSTSSIGGTLEWVSAGGAVGALSAAASRGF